MAIRKEGPGTNDNGSFRSISDCTPEMEERAVEVVRCNSLSVEEARRNLNILGLTGVAEGMLAARDARAG